VEVLSLRDRRRCLIRLGGVLNVGVSHLSFAPMLFGGPGSLATAAASAATSSRLTAVSRVAALSGLALAAPEASTASTEGAALSPRRVVILVAVLFLDNRESFVVGPVFPEAATIAAATAVASASKAASLALLVAKKTSLSLFLLSLRGASRSFLSRNALLLLVLLMRLMVVSRLRVVDGRRVPLLAQEGLALRAGEG